jgi:very-short-patch-repair endonuclease
VDENSRHLWKSVHGSVRREWLLARGLTRRQIEHALLTGRLHRVHAGVYAVGRPLSTPVERANAAVLACGERSAVARLSALALWELPGPGWPATPVVLVAGGRPRHPSIEIHRSRTLLRRDVRRVQGIRVTSPARTLLDCAPHLTPAQLRRAVNAALRRHLVRRSQLADVAARNPRHPGARALRDFAAERSAATRSPFEDDFQTFCREHELPIPQTNASPFGFEVDAYFALERVIVELDGYEFHSGRETFESDRERDAHHLACGVVTLRMTWARIHRHPRREAARLRVILAARRERAA